MLFIRKILRVWRKHFLSKIQQVTQKKVAIVQMNMSMKDKKNMLTNKVLDLCHSNNKKKVKEMCLISDLSLSE